MALYGDVLRDWRRAAGKRDGGLYQARLAIRECGCLRSPFLTHELLCTAIMHARASSSAWTPSSPCAPVGQLTARASPLAERLAAP